MTSRQRQEITAQALQYMLQTGQHPVWGSTPYNSECYIETYRDRLQAMYFYLVKHEKYLARIDTNIAKKIVLIRKDTVYKDIFINHAESLGYKTRLVEEIHFPNIRQNETVNTYRDRYFGDVTRRSDTERNEMQPRSPTLAFSGGTTMAAPLWTTAVSPNIFINDDTPF